MAQKQLIDIVLLGKFDAKIKNSYIADKESGINTKLGTLPTGNADFVSYINAQIASVNGAATTLEARVAANETAIGKAKAGEVAATGLYLYTDTTVKNAIDAIVNADDPVGSIDKLNEIAAWIVNDQTGAAKMAADITALKGSATDTEDSNSIVGAKKYADKAVGDKNVTAEGETGDAALVSASAASNKVTVASTQKLIAAVALAETSVQHVTGGGTGTYVDMTVTDGANAKVEISDAKLATKIGAKKGTADATGMYADIQGQTTSTLKDVEDALDEFVLANAADYPDLFA